MRLTIVPVEAAMDKEVHARNAFHYSCWGAHPVAATSSELGRDEFGFSLVGSDGRNGRHKPGYYIERAVIPSVVPDGDYILGWTWYGGTGGHVLGNEPQKPGQFSYFGDYWSCSFVRIKGGASLSRRYTPIFENSMRRFSDKGCMSFTDRPGICEIEPCLKIRGKYQKPAEFRQGRTPMYLTPRNFIVRKPMADKGMKKNMKMRNSPTENGKIGKHGDRYSKPRHPRMRTGWGKHDQAAESSQGPSPSITPILKQKRKNPRMRTGWGKHDQAAEPSQATSASESPILMSNAKRSRMRTGWGKGGHAAEQSKSPLLMHGSVTKFPDPSMMPAKKENKSKTDQITAVQKFLSCLCISKNHKCKRNLASITKCRFGSPAAKQTYACVKHCCEYCESNTRSELCKSLGAKGGCVTKS